MGEASYKITGSLTDTEQAFNDLVWSQEDQDRGMKTVDWSEHKHFIVARDDKEIVGVLEVDFKAGTGRITEVIVAKESRGKGLGKGLMLECEKLAKENNIHKLWLETRPEYEAAYKLYLILGYQVEAEFQNYFNQQDYLVMSKDLKLDNGNPD